MTLDVISMITRDHRDVEALFDRLKKNPEDRPVLLVELAAKFVAHSKGEEDLVYPEIAKVVPQEKTQVQEGADEHHKAEELMFRLLGMDPDGKEFESLLLEVEQAINHHVQEEENEILPAFQRAVDRKRLEELGRAFSEHKAQEIMKGLPVGNGNKRAGAKQSGQRKQGAGAKGDLGDMSKEELYERAKEADIPGRSEMTKEELVKALQKTGKS